MQHLYAGVDCAPGSCMCGQVADVTYKCVAFLDEMKTRRCGHVLGPYRATYRYHPQGKGHFLTADREDDLIRDMREDHGHGHTNYYVPTNSWGNL